MTAITPDPRMVIVGAAPTGRGVELVDHVPLAEPETVWKARRR